MHGAKDFMMEWVTFVGGSVGLPDALEAFDRCEDHPMMWLLRIVVPGIHRPEFLPCPA